MDTVLVIILVGEATNSIETRIEILKHLFSNPLFRTEVFHHDPPGEIQASDGLTVKNKIETLRFRAALEYAHERAPTSAVIIVKDSSISNVDPTRIEREVKKARDLQVDYDLFYLTKWLDQCQKQREIPGQGQGEPNLVWTQSPYGVQCLYLTTSGRDIIRGQIPMRNGQYFLATKSLSVQLSEEIYRSNIKAITTRVNLLNYDMSLALSNTDYLKMNECQPVTALTQGTESSNNYLYFVLIIILILILTWSVVKS
jgi:hypothetical protein